MVVAKCLRVTAPRLKEGMGIEMLWRKKKADGWIAAHKLVDWWFATFTEEERRYMNERYRPMGLPAGTLTKGKWTSSQPTTEFLSGLASWFRSKKDADIARRIYEKIDELGKTQPVRGPGYYQGRHFTTYVHNVETLKRQGQLREMERLLIELVKATEAEAKADKMGVAPWYYEELAKLYRKQRDYTKEVAILERFAKQQHASGVMPARLLQRLEKAKRLASKK